MAALALGLALGCSRESAPAEQHAEVPAPEPFVEAEPAKAELAAEGRSEAVVERGGLRWSTVAELEAKDGVLVLVIEVELSNTSAESSKAAVLPSPRVSTELTALPGVVIEGVGALGMSGEGWGGDPCGGVGSSFGVLEAGASKTQTRRYELPELPWPEDYGHVVRAVAPDCRGDRVDVELFEVLVAPPRDQAPARLLSEW